MTTINTPPLTALPPPIEYTYQTGLTLSKLEAIRADLSERLTTITTPFEIATESGRLAGVLYALGEAAGALAAVETALRAAEAAKETALGGYLACVGGAAACFQGQYQRGANYFEEAEQAFAASGDSIGEAFRRQAYAREYASDLRQFSKTTEYLTVAVQVLRGRVPQTVIIENLLTQAACMVHQNELRRTREIIQQAEALMNEQKAHWFRPELAVIKADIAVLEGNTEDALKHCYTGLGGIGDSGDLRMLSPLYLLLGIILEREKNRESDVQDALDRAIATGRVRARRLHLALALRQMGMHMRRLTARNTVRAKGSGFLFEAERMLGEIQLSEQFPTAPAAPLPQIL